MRVNTEEVGTLLYEEEDVTEDGMIAIIGLDGQMARILQESLAM